GPRIEVLELQNDALWPVGDELDLRVAVTDAKGVPIDSIRVNVAGAFALDTLFLLEPPRADTVVSVTLTPEETGRLTISARAWNADGIGGRAPSDVSLDVVSDVITDATPPTVELRLERVEH